MHKNWRRSKKCWRLLTKVLVIIFVVVGFFGGGEDSVIFGTEWPSVFTVTSYQLLEPVDYDYSVNNTGSRNLSIAIYGT